MTFGSGDAGLALDECGFLSEWGILARRYSEDILRFKGRKRKYGAVAHRVASAAELGKSRSRETLHGPC